MSTDASTDNVTPKDKWEFDQGVADAFDDMLARSIPQYEVMRAACNSLACAYAQPHTDILDIGCSRGEALSTLVDKYGARNRFIGVDMSTPMLEAARARFKALINTSVVDIREHDLRSPGTITSNASVVLSVLTIQFTPIEYRLRILTDLYKSLRKGGALILVEKVLGATHAIDSAQVDAYYGYKESNGYSQDQIDRKRLSLEGVLVPVTAHMNEEFLRAAGFNQVDSFWRWMNFAGWIAIKD